MLDNKTRQSFFKMQNDALFGFAGLGPFVISLRSIIIDGTRPGAEAFRYSGMRQRTKRLEG